MTTEIEYHDDLVQDCSISSALALSTNMMKLVIHLVNFGLYNEYLRSYLKDHNHEFTSILPLQRRRNGRDGVSNHRWLELFSTVCSGADKKTKTSKLLVAGLCEQDPLATGGLPSQKASNAENASIWWRHHGITYKGKYSTSPPVTGGFPSQKACNAENVSIWWCDHGITYKGKYSVTTDVILNRQILLRRILSQQHIFYSTISNIMHISFGMHV